MTATLQPPSDVTPGGLLSHLADQGVVSAPEAENVRREISRGATLFTALALMTDERAVWAHLAQTAGRRFLRTHQELQVFFTDLFGFEFALRHQVLPWRSRGRELQVVTYNPEAEDGPVAELPGLQLRCAVVSPTVWRYLYDLAYPTSLTGTLSQAQAQALVTLTALGSPATTTPEQHAEILAMTHGYHYIDLRRDPLDEDVRSLVTTPLKSLTRAYPHHREGSRLVMMMVDPEDDLALHRLRQQTQLDIIPTVTTQAVIDELIARDQADGLWTETEDA